MATSVTVDVLVVGAGPAGSAAALAAARSGARVLMVERRSRVGEPVQCGEWLSVLVPPEFRPPEAAVAQPVSAMRTQVWGSLGAPGSVLAESRVTTPGFMLRRALYDRWLASRAVEAGAELWTQARALQPLPHGAVVLRRAGAGAATPFEAVEVRAAVVIGADGPDSTVGGWMESRNPYVMAALTWDGRRPEAHGAAGETEAYFAPEIAGGYGWSFPKGAGANVGLGVGQAALPALPGGNLHRIPGGVQLRRLAQAFHGHLVAAGRLVGLPGRATGGLIPAGGPLPRLHVGRCILAGDAAGLTHAITGAGIPQALFSGELAGRAAAAAAGGQGEAALGQYAQQIWDLLAPLLVRAAQRREQRDGIWRSLAQPAEPDWADLLRWSWVGFPGYRASPGPAGP